MHDLDLTKVDASEDEDLEALFEAMDDESLYFTGETGPLDEAEELELAAELLEVGDDEELEEFIGNLVKQAAGGLKKFASSKVGQALGKGLKTVAKKALPIASTALGNLVAPGVGGVIGGQLGSLATKLFEFESEGMSDEELQLEMAKRFVRLGAGAAQKAAKAPPSANPRAVAQNAIAAAAKQHAPGLARRLSPRSFGGGPLLPGTAGAESGRWIRRGRKIIVLGV
ncbi:MAG TPA: hypothetical protein VKY73_23040 [Polyangiaceae bacterium]|nr:hypothetical protein [Polyangiaceae bacterium]